MKRIVIAGGSGFLGQALSAHFLKARWDVAILTRDPNRTGGVGRQVAWDACTLGAWQREVDGSTAVVNLTGKSVNCRYHVRNRREILESRLNSTRVVGDAIGRSVHPPEVWLNSSTATIYKHTFAAPWDESGEIGAAPEAKDAFSIDVAKAWERIFVEAHTPQTRKVALRSAMALGMGKNSVFPVLRRLVRLGLGGKLGNGRQFVSWIHEVDYCRAIEWLINHDQMCGPVNLAAPSPLSNGEMMKILRRICHASIGLPASSWMLEVGAFFLRTETELIIKSRRVIPRRLLESGFQFRFPLIKEAFEDLCGQAA
jgi:uncharacterized protein (TIGR01777 family)